MIERKNVLQIGRIEKAHGLQGELAFSFTFDAFDEALDKMPSPFLICEIDGILVPFFIESLRFKNDETALVKFENINDEKQADFLYKAPIFIEKKYIDEDLSAVDVEGANYYVGFTIYDENNDEVGEITAIDDSTENVLFCVVDEEENEFYVPAVDDYIIAINDEERAIQMVLPEGLTEINSQTTPK